MNQYIGQLLDNRYEILEVIGTGGMAVVYKARCHRLNRLVAVKVLKDEYFGDEEFRRRFRAEGEAVAMLSHPNIVQVFDVSSADNSYYIVMELIDGISLKQYMEVKGILNWKETLHFATQIAKGLEHAHSRGIVHRDIKPHNIMVLKNGSVKVMDFGIAQVMNKASTLTKEALGSVHYISPEQAKGSYTDNRSDIYSLGVVMYEMMTGRPPYDGESPVAVAIKHINGGAPMPSTLNPNIPAAMEQIIMKAMALDPRDRYGSAGQLLQDLEEFRKNPGVQFQYRTVMDDATRNIGNISKAVNRTEPETRTRPSSNTSRGNLTLHSDNSSRIPMDLPPEETVKRSREAMLRAQKRRQEEAKRQEERTRVSTIAVVACSFVAVIAIVVFLVAVFNGALINQERDLVDVPFVVSELYSEDFAAKYADFSIRFNPQEYDDFYVAGQIMRQEPAGGSKVKKGTELFLTISMGEEPKVKLMEDLIGVPQDQATSFLLGQGFKYFSKEEPSDIYKAGTVVRTEPEEGVELLEGQTIRLWISTGPEHETAKMPYVVDQTEDAALKILDSIGFRNVTTVKVPSTNKVKGNVVSQSQTSGIPIDVTTHIILEISQGPETNTLQMPKVLEMDADAAMELLTQRGFNNVRTYSVESDRPKGQVVSQSEAADSMTAPDKEISLGVSEGPKESAPSSAMVAPTGAIQEVPTQPAEPVTKYVSFSVPVRQADYSLMICRKGHPEQQIAVGQVRAGESTYNVQLGDSGVQEYDIYIDGVYYQSQKVTFQENG